MVPTAPPTYHNYCMQHGRWVTRWQWSQPQRGRKTATCLSMGHESEISWRQRLERAGVQPTLEAARALQWTPEQLAAGKPLSIDVPTDDDGALGGHEWDDDGGGGGEALLPPPSPRLCGGGALSSDRRAARARRRERREPLDGSGFKRRSPEEIAAAEARAEAEADRAEDGVVGGNDAGGDDSDGGGEAAAEEGGGGGSGEREEVGGVAVGEAPAPEGGPEVDEPEDVRNVAAGEREKSSRQYWRVVRHTLMPEVKGVARASILTHVYNYTCLVVCPLPSPPHASCRCVVVLQHQRRR